MLFAQICKHTHAHTHSHCSYIQEEMVSKNSGGSERLGKDSVCVSVPLFSRKDWLYTHISHAYHTRTQQWWLFSLAVLINENNGHHMYTHIHIHPLQQWLISGWLAFRQNSKNFGEKWKGSLYISVIILKERLRTHVHNNGWRLSIIFCVTHTHKYAHTQVSITAMTDLWMVTFQMHSGRILRILGRDEKAFMCFCPLFSRKERDCVRKDNSHQCFGCYAHTQVCTHTCIHYNDDRSVGGCISVKNLIQGKWKGLKKIPCVFLHVILWEEE